MQSVATAAELEALAAEERTVVYVVKERALFMFRRINVPVSSGLLRTSKGGSTRWMRMSTKA